MINYNLRGTNTIKRLTALFATSFLVVPVCVVHAQTEAPLQKSTSQFMDWAIDCRDIDSSEQCFANQSIFIKGQDSPLLVARILEAEPNKLTAILSLPKNTFLLPGIELQIDENNPTQIGFEACNDNGCHAGFPLTPSIYRQMLRGNTAFVRFQSQDGDLIQLPLSLTGFTAATNNLLER